MPTLFNLYSERIINEALDEEEGISINGHRITTTRYADDTVVLAKSEADLQRMMNKLVLTSNMYGMAWTSMKKDEGNVSQERKSKSKPQHHS